MADTPDEKVAEHLFGAADGRIFRLSEERAALLRAPDRIAEIDSELAILQVETARLEPRRPRPPPPPPPVDPPADPPVDPPVDEPPVGGVRSPNVNSTRK